MTSSTFVVVGAGLAGASTAWRLAEAGHDVTLLERGQPADRGGSSHGSARIFRHSYPSRTYTDLTVRARPLWRELEDAAGETLLTTTGCLDWGPARDVGALARSLDDVGVEYELVAADEATRRWAIPFETPVLWQPGAGVLDAERTVGAMVRLATAHGVRLRTGFEVTRIERTSSGYRVHGADGPDRPEPLEPVEAERVVVCAGGFLPRLLEDCALDERFRAGLPSFRVSQEQAYHFPFRDPDASWPAFIHKTADIQTYGLPGGRDAAGRGLKVAEYAAGKVLASGYDQDGAIDPAHRRRIVDYVTAHLPGVVPEPYAEATCLFTITPTEDFVLDRSDGLTVVSPCSGHGAKFAPLIGILAAHLAAAPTAAAGRAVLPREFLVGAGGPSLSSAR